LNRVNEPGPVAKPLAGTFLFVTSGLSIQYVVASGVSPASSLARSSQPNEAVPSRSFAAVAAKLLPARIMSSADESPLNDTTNALLPRPSTAAAAPWPRLSKLA